jgi:hypothetical protein
MNEGQLGVFHQGILGWTWASYCQGLRCRGLASDFMLPWEIQDSVLCAQCTWAVTWVPSSKA